MNNFLITFEITNNCNLKCLHCLRDKTLEKKDLPFQLLKKIVAQAKRYNMPYVALTGGEPTIHGDFFKILKHLSSQGFEYHFVTNGYNFADIYKKLLPYKGKGLTRICFSLDGATEAIHNRIRVKGSFRKTMEGIAICKTRNIPCSVQMVINKLNRHEIREMAYLASKMEFTDLYYSHMHPTFGNATYNIQLPPDEWIKVEEEISELKKTFKIPITLSAGFFDESPLSHCQFLQGGALNIDYNGNLTFCCQISSMFDGSTHKKDIIANLGNTSLFKAHKTLLDRINEISKKRIDALEKGKLTKLDYFHCWFCSKEFKKIDWMKVLKDNEWAKRDPYFQAGSKVKWEKPQTLQN